MDFITDESGRHIKRIDSVIAVPEFVKNCSVDPDATASLARTQFANPSQREFPIDEPGHVYLSYAYLKSAKIHAPNVETRIKRAAALFGIADELPKIDAALEAATVKSASAPAEPQFALTFLDDSDGTEKQANYFPINSAEEVVDSAKSLCDHKHRVPLPLFVEASRNLVKAAADHGVGRREIPKLVWEYGEERLVDLEHVKFAAEQRQKHTGDDVYADLAKIANETDQPIDDVVDAWFKADVQNGVVYDHHTTDPYQIFYSGITKAAAEQYAAKLVLLGNSPVPFTVLAKLPEGAIKKAFPGPVATKALELVKSAATVTSGAELDSVIATFDPAVQRVLLAMAVAQA